MDTQEQENHTQEKPTEVVEIKKGGIGLPSAILTGAVIIAIAIFATFGSSQPKSTPPKSDTTPTQVAGDIVKIKSQDHVRGDIGTAEVAIIEYSDSDCPFCSKFHITLTDLMKEYNGKLVWVYRHYPLTQLHPNAYNEALALECTGQLGGNDLFNQYLDKVIDVTLNSGANGNNTLTEYATSLGIDSGLFNSCMKNTATAKIIDASIAEAQSVGARGTPFSIAVNLKTGKQVVIPGAYPIESVRANIDSLLK